MDKPAGEIIIVVDDDPMFLDATRQALELVVPETQIRPCLDADQARFEYSRANGSMLIIADHQLPDEEGISLLTSLAPRAGDWRVILSAYDDQELLTRATGLGIDGVFEKPLGFEALQEMLAGIVASWRNRHR